MLVATLVAAYHVSAKPFDCFEFRCFETVMIGAVVAPSCINPPDHVAVVSVEEAPDRARIEAHLRQSMSERPNHNTVLVGFHDGATTQQVVDVIDICRGLGLIVLVIDRPVLPEELGQKIRVNGQAKESCSFE